MRPESPRGAKPHAPALSAAAEQDRQERATYVREREQLEHRSMWRGVFWLALIALGFAIFHSGLGRSFYSGWWRQW